MANRKPIQFFAEELGRPMLKPDIRQATMQRVKDHFVCGKFGGEVHEDIFRLLQLVDDSGIATGKYDRVSHDINRLADVAEDAHRDNAKLRDQIKLLEENFPPPIHEDCGCEMDLDSSGSAGIYYCGTCFEGRCTCFQCAPCSWCMHTIFADDWMSGEIQVGETLEKQKKVAASIKEAGPSAAEAAKPVTPKHVITCQGDYWDGVENL